MFAEVYRLAQPADAQTSGLHLEHHKSIRGVARLNRESTDFTGLLGLGYAPDVSVLRETLAGGARRAKATTLGFFKFRWGDDIDPRTSEPHVRIPKG